MHSSQGTAHNPSQGTAQGRQAVGSWCRQGPDQPPLGVHRQHPQRKHDSADPSKTTHVQAWGCPASPRQTVSLTVRPYWWTAASRAWRLTGISKMGGDRQRGVQYRQPQAGKWIPQLPWHTTTGICLHRTVAVVMSSSSPERQQQLSVIRKYALARSATLRDLLECPRGPHHSTTAAAPTKKEKAATASLLSTLLGLRLIAWPRRMATLLAHGGRSGTSAGWLQSPGRWRTPFTPPPQKGHQRGENGYYRTSIINWTQSFTWGAAGNIMQPPCQWHSGWLPCVGTLPGPLPKMPVTGPGPDQGTGPRQVLATLPKVCGVQSCWWPPCHLGGRLQGQRTRTMAAAPGARAKVSCGSGRHRRHPSDDTWPLVAQRRGSRFWPGRTWQTRPKPHCPRPCETGLWLYWGGWGLAPMSAGHLVPLI